MGLKIIKDDRRKWDRLARVLRNSRDAAVEVGVRGDGKQRSGEGPSNVAIGTIHEFGIGTSPKRSWLRETVDSKQRSYRRLLQRLGGEVVELKMDLDDAMNLVGLQVAKDMRTRIRNKIPPPNADATIARKGSTTPLIDTSQFIRSITHKVVRK